MRNTIRFDWAIKRLLRNKAAKEELDRLKLSKEAMAEYERDLAYWRDNESLMNTRFIEGEQKGRLDEKIEMAKNCLADGMSVEKTAKLTGLTEDEVRDISYK